MSSSVLVVHGQAAVRNAVRQCLEQARHGVVEAQRLRLSNVACPDLMLVGQAALEPVAESISEIRNHDNTSGTRLIVLAPLGAAAAFRQAPPR